MSAPHRPNPRREGPVSPGWTAFGCLLVPVVLLWCGTSFAGAAGTALGLAAVTAACRLLLRRTGTGAGAEAGERTSTGDATGARGGGRGAGESTPVA